MPRIPEELIDRIKQTTDLVAVIKARGVKLRKRGKQHKGRCPFHEGKTPFFTVTPAEHLWHCFGCDTGGDVIRFVELMDKVDFPEAVKRLNGHQLNAFVEPPASNKKSPSLTADRPVVNPTQRVISPGSASPRGGPMGRRRTNSSIAHFLATVPWPVLNGPPRVRPGTAAAGHRALPAAR